MMKKITKRGIKNRISFLLVFLQVASSVGIFSPSNVYAGWVREDGDHMTITIKGEKPNPGDSGGSKGEGGDRTAGGYGGGERSSHRVPGDEAGGSGKGSSGGGGVLSNGDKSQTPGYGNGSQGFGDQRKSNALVHFQEWMSSKKESVKQSIKSKNSFGVPPKFPTDNELLQHEASKGGYARGYTPSDIKEILSEYTAEEDREYSEYISDMKAASQGLADQIYQSADDYTSGGKGVNEELNFGNAEDTNTQEKNTQEKNAQEASGRSSSAAGDDGSGFGEGIGGGMDSSVGIGVGAGIGGGMDITSQLNPVEKFIYDGFQSTDPEAFEDLLKSKLIIVGFGELGVAPGADFQSHVPQKISADQISTFEDRLSAAIERLQNAKPTSEPGHLAKTMGLEAFGFARGDHQNGNHQSAEFMLQIGIALTEIAMGFIPGVGFAKDIYEALSGRNLLNGEELDIADRAFAIFGAVTLGYGGKIASSLYKALGSMGRIAGRYAGKSYAAASKVVRSGARLGIKTGDKIKSFAQSFKSNPTALEKVEEITTNIGKSPSALKAINQTPVGRPAFYVNAEGKAVPATAYRHFGSDSVEFVKDSIVKTGKIPEHPGSGNYLTFEKIDNAAQAKDLLQVKHDARFRVAVDTLENVNDIVVPNGKWGAAEWLEPIVKDMTDFGAGGASQAVTKNALPGVLEVKDLVTGEILFKK